MATSGNIRILSRKGVLGKEPMYYVFNWERVSYSTVDNTSTINWSVDFYPETGGTIALKQTIMLQFDNPLNVAEFILGAGSYINPIKPLVTGTQTIKHNLDGTKTVTLIATEIGVTNERTDSATFELDALPRQAVLLSVSNFTDEGAPTIVYDNPAGVNAGSLQACISLTGASDDIAYRDIPKDQSSYTFPLTTAERNVLRNAMGSKVGLTVRVYVKSIVSGITYWSYRNAYCTLENGEPTLSPVVVDSNARTKELTGDENTFIKYYSNAAFTTGAAAIKGAAIDTQYVTNGSVTINNQDSGTINGVTSNTFYFGVTDNRGYTTRDAIVVDLIPYTKLTASLTTKSLTASGSLTFTVKGKYFSGSFGAKDNSLEVEYAVRDKARNYVTNPEGSGWVKLGTVTPEVSGNDYSYSYTITGLNHTEQYELSVNVIDELTPVQNVTTVIKAIPVFDWGEDDFHHHTNVELERGKKLYTHGSYNNQEVQLIGINSQDDIEIGATADLEEAGDTNIYGNNIKLQAFNSVNINGYDYGVNNILWRGESHMNANQTANLSQSISAQAHGIVLVFSFYELTEETAADHSWTCHFIPKQAVNLSNGGGFTFFMGINAGFSSLGAKYLYISNTQIKGHTGNTSSGVNSNVGFNNAEYCLRYVIGV